MPSLSVPAPFIPPTVIAVPPLARTPHGRICAEQNARLIRHLEQGGIRLLLYGGNALLPHVAPSEYSHLLELLKEIPQASTQIIPSAGPGYGMLCDQAEQLRDFGFPTAMLLPTRDGSTPAGVARAVHAFVQRLGRPIVVYLKSDDYLDVATLKGLMNDGLIAWIKYAIVRDDPGNDTFLQHLCDVFDPQRLISGMGEQPAIIHMTRFGLSGFTSGCVCIDPRSSQQMLMAIRQRDMHSAERIRALFRPLETLRDQIHPVRVLHAAVELAHIACTGPISPLQSPLSAAQIVQVAAALDKLVDCRS